MKDFKGIYLKADLLANKNLSRTQKELYALLLQLKKAYGNASFPNEYLGERLGIQIRHVNRCLKKLKENKLIEIYLSKIPIPNRGFAYEREIEILP